MKALILIVILGLASFSVTVQGQASKTTIVGGYSSVSSDDIKNNKDIQSLADYGAQAVVAQAKADKKLSDNNDQYSVGTINSVSQQVVAGINYKYDVQIVNTDKSVVINAQYVVFYQSWTNTKEVTITSYSVQKVQPVVGGYSPVSSNDVRKNKDIQSLADYGAQAVVAQAKADKKLGKNNDQYSVGTINSVSQQVVAGINYKYDVQIVNTDKSVVINAQYIVFYQSWTNTKKVTITSYSVQKSQPVAGGYSPVSSNDIKNNKDIQSLADLGAQAVVAQAKTDKKLSDNNDQYSVGTINSVSQQVVAGINYKYDVQIVNNDKSVAINAQYVVFYQSWTNTKEVTIISYSVQETQPVAGGYSPVSSNDIKNNKDIQSLAKYGAQAVITQAKADKNLSNNNDKYIISINSVSQQVVAGINYKYNVKIVNAAKNVTINAQYVVFYQSWTNTKKVTITSYTVQKTNSRNLRGRNIKRT